MKLLQFLCSYNLKKQTRSIRIEIITIRLTAKRQHKNIYKIIGNCAYRNKEKGWDD